LKHEDREAQESVEFYCPRNMVSAPYWFCSNDFR
jgi:hypothetical protein